MSRVILARTVLILVTSALIVLLLPRSSSRAIKVVEGAPWTQSAVIAPYEIPIYKSKTVIAHERDSVKSLLSPYYKCDQEAGQKQAKRFLARFSTGIEGLPKSFTGNVSRKLTEIYSVGIMSQEAYSSFKKDSTATIQVVSGKTTKKQLVRTTFTPLTAYEYFFSDPQMAAVRQQLQQCNLNEYLVENLSYDKELTEKDLNERLSLISLNKGFIQQGERIVDRGEIVSPEIARKLESYSYELSKNDSNTSLIVTLTGQIIFVLLIITLFTTYLHLFRGDYFHTPRAISMVYILLVLFPSLVALMMRFGFIDDYVYVLPFAIVPILTRVFLDSRTAVMALFAVVMLSSLSVADQYTFMVTQILSGIVAVYALRELSRRSQILIAAALVCITNVLIMYVIHLMLPGDDVNIDMIAVKFMVLSAFFVLLLYPLMFLVEKLFGFTSAVTLFELSDTNKDLLRNLSEVANGTFQHSFMVGNLASAVASKIGGKSLLVRTGALYHDIGKMTNPVFFTENQSGVNPHDRMTPIESAQLIVSHVTEGLKLADKYGLPDVIKDFIRTHHGAGMAKYFYITYKNAHPDEDVDVSLFSYPGPNPFTKEQAILMMCDAVEAASRSLSEYTEESITTLVNRIIDGQVADGYFRECPITFRDIAMAKLVLIDKLKSNYHTRISYPTLVRG